MKASVLIPFSRGYTLKLPTRFLFPRFGSVGYEAERSEEAVRSRFEKIKKVWITPGQLVVKP